jgi:hypothetical protein
MATIEVDIGLFLFTIITAFFALPFMAGWSLWKGYKNPEFWLKLRRVEWVYALVRTPMLALKQVVVPLKEIGENGEFRIFGKRRYFWQGKAKDGSPLALQWRNKKMACLYDWNDPYPQKWTPATLDDISEMKALLMMMNADSMTKLMRVALVVSVIGLLFISGLAFTVYSQSASVDHLACILKAGNNGTLAAMCH